LQIWIGRCHEGLESVALLCREGAPVIFPPFDLSLGFSTLLLKSLQACPLFLLKGNSPGLTLCRRFIPMGNDERGA
jgi:hypothetical protein